MLGATLNHRISQCDGGKKGFARVVARGLQTLEIMSFTARFIIHQSKASGLEVGRGPLPRIRTIYEIMLILDSSMLELIWILHRR